jgi:hypothetical protein
LNVSSILNALKKLEQETGGKTTGFLPEKAGKPYGQGKKTLVFGILALVFFSLVVAGSVRYFSKPRTAEIEIAALKDDDPAPETLASSTINAEGTADKADHPPQKSVAAEAAGHDFVTSGERTTDFLPAEFQQKMPRLSDDGTRRSPVAPPAAAPMKKAAGSGIFRPDAPVPDHLPEIANLQDPPQPAASMKPEPDLPASAKAAVQEESLANTEARGMKSRVAVLADPAIELQAISWSVDPEKRLAIINGRICREKEHVAGYLIDAIDAEEVVLSKGAVSGKLVFKVR